MTEPAEARPALLLPMGGALVASTATVVGDVTFGRGANVWYGSVLRGDCAPISVGEMTNVQDLSVVHADTDVPNEIGSYVTIGHGAMVHGRRVGDRCLIGIGAIVLGGAEIGDGSIIAAGAVVRERSVIPPRSLVMGVPGKIVREVREDEVATLVRQAEHYWELAKSHCARA